MRVLGIDPGLTRCGYGVVDTFAGRRVSFVDVGVVRSEPHAEIGSRLATIHDGLEAVLDRHRPDEISMERLFAQHNRQTVMGIAQVSGVIMLLAHRHGIPLTLYTPSQVKAAVSGYGGADKGQVQRMVQTILGLAEPPQPADAADALAIAITRSWRPPTAASDSDGPDLTPAQRAWADALRRQGRTR